MQFFVTNFYQVRNLPQNMLPISINSGEPNWYHDFKGRNHVFKDKRGIWNGGYIDEISSSNLTCDPNVCHECGRYKYIGDDCSFMQAFREKLNKLDFGQVLKKLEKVAKHFNCQDICFVAYEKPDVVCGERWVIKKWFEDNKVEVKEFYLKTTKKCINPIFSKKLKTA